MLYLFTLFIFLNKIKFIIIIKNVNKNDTSKAIKIVFIIQTSNDLYFKNENIILIIYNKNKYKYIIRKLYIWLKISK